MRLTMFCIGLSCLLLGNVPAIAQDAALAREETTLKLLEVKPRHLAQAKEITPNCVANPIPTTPGGPRTTIEISRSNGEHFQITLWRQPCGSGTTDAQLILTFVPLQGSPVICANDMKIIQGGVESDDFFLTRDPSGASSDTLCGPVSVPTSALIRVVDNLFVFDDDAAFSFVYEQTSPSPDVTVNIPAYDPSQYPGGGVRPPHGIDSGSYFDPSRPFEGVFVEVGRVGDRRVLFVSWYTYDNGAPLWIIGNVDFPEGAHSVTMPMSTYAGTGFGPNFNPSEVVATHWGHATFSVLSCSELSFNWIRNDGLSGNYNYVRLVEGLLGTTCG